MGTGISVLVAADGCDGMKEDLHFCFLRGSRSLHVASLYLLIHPMICSLTSEQNLPVLYMVLAAPTPLFAKLIPLTIELLSLPK